MKGNFSAGTWLAGAPLNASEIRLVSSLINATSIIFHFKVSEDYLK
jgi:hypothetical protein